MTNLNQVTYNDFEKICPILLYNTELRDCLYEEDVKHLSSQASNYIILKFKFSIKIN